MGYEDLPRVSLINLPTPLEELHRLRQAIGGPRILLKRDDLTGLGLGGNKSRKLEFLLGDALRRGADAIITSGGIQTNHGRLTAAACAKLGLACYLVFTEEENGVYEGNRILQTMFGAKQVFCDNIDHSLPRSACAPGRRRSPNSPGACAQRERRPTSSRAADARSSARPAMSRPWTRSRRSWRRGTCAWTTSSRPAPRPRP